MTDQASPETDSASSHSGRRFQRQILIAGGLLAGAVVLIFVIGLVFALLSDVEATAARVGVLRDLFIIILALEFIVVIGALIVLILQVARLIHLLQQDIHPVLKNAQETVESARGTVSFVSENVAQPVIRVRAFLAGASVLVREIGGIRRAIRQTKATTPNDQNKSSS